MTKGREKFSKLPQHTDEAMNELEWEIPVRIPASRELFFELMDFVQALRLKSDKIAELNEADNQHHIAMQKVFKKWREVHDEKKLTPEQKKSSGTSKLRRKK
jgi:hypothetical protein